MESISVLMKDLSKRTDKLLIKIYQTYMLLKQNMLNEATTIVSEILKDNPSYPPALLCYASIRLCQKDENTAIKYLKN
eukprot:UN20573